MVSSPERNWAVSYVRNNVHVTVTVRLGIEWWSYLGGNDAWLEVLVSLIRACIEPTPVAESLGDYMISDLASIVSLASVPSGFNTGVLQQSQLPWLLFLGRHFCDGYTEG